MCQRFIWRLFWAKNSLNARNYSLNGCPLFGRRIAQSGPCRPPKKKQRSPKGCRTRLPGRTSRAGPNSPSEFNLLHRGEAPVSPQTAHKWLTGRTIPTPDKLQTLADWLGVGMHWLHYGPPPPVGIKAKPLAPGEKYPLTPETIELASKIEALDPKDRTSSRSLSTACTTPARSESRRVGFDFNCTLKKPPGRKPGGFFTACCGEIGLSASGSTPTTRLARPQVRPPWSSAYPSSA